MAAVTPNQVANQLLRNGNPAHKERGHLKAMKRETTRIIQECKSNFESFRYDDLQEAMSTLKPVKAAGLDRDDTTLRAQHFSMDPGIHQQLRSLIYHSTYMEASEGSGPAETRK